MAEAFKRVLHLSVCLVGDAHYEQLIVTGQDGSKPPEEDGGPAVKTCQDKLHLFLSIEEVGGLFALFIVNVWSWISDKLMVVLMTLALGGLLFQLPYKH